MKRLILLLSTIIFVNYIYAQSDDYSDTEQNINNFLQQQQQDLDDQTRRLHNWIETIGQNGQTQNGTSGGIRFDYESSSRSSSSNNYYEQQRQRKTQRDAEHQEWLKRKNEAARLAAERERQRRIEEERERQRKYDKTYTEYMITTERHAATFHDNLEYKATTGKDFMYNYQPKGTEKLQHRYVPSSGNVSTSDIVDEQRKSRNNQNVIKLLDGKYYQSSSNWDEFMSQKSNFVDTEWDFFKKTNNLQDEDINSFLIRVYGEAENLLNKKLKVMGLTKEEFADSLKNEYKKLNNYIIQENANYNAEHDCLEKILLLAKYKVDYKATLNLIYQESLDKNPASQNIAKKNELFYREELEKSEKKLIEKGISIEDINRIKTQTENEALIKNKVSSDVHNIADGDVNDMMKNNLLGNIVSGIKEGVPLGVMVNDQITIESYKIVSDALEKQLDLMEVDHKKSKEFYKKRMNEIQTLSELVEIPSVSGSTNLLSSDKYESLKKGKKVYYAIECLKQSPPDINKKEKWEENNYFFKK